MTISQLNAAMDVLCPGASYSFQLDPSGNLVWIRFEQPGTCPTVEQVNDQVQKG